MSLPHSSPQVVAFLESLKEEYPEEFTPDTPVKQKNRELQVLNEEIVQLEELQKEQLIGPIKAGDPDIRTSVTHPPGWSKPDYHPLDWSNGISRMPSPRLPDLEGD